jgi:hypothetical protein
MSQLTAAISRLVAAGHIVEGDPIIPGLYRIDGGPELTVGQLIDFASRLAPV